MKRCKKHIPLHCGRWKRNSFKCYRIIKLMEAYNIHPWHCRKCFSALFLMIDGLWTVFSPRHQFYTSWGNTCTWDMSILYLNQSNSINVSYCTPIKHFSCKFVIFRNSVEIFTGVHFFTFPEKLSGSRSFTQMMVNGFSFVSLFWYNISHGTVLFINSCFKFCYRKTELGFEHSGNCRMHIP